MFISLATMTGADHSVTPDMLFEASKIYPFIEWGILVSKKDTLSYGCNRFPNRDWINNLVAFAETHPMNLSCHICGVWSRDALVGHPSFIQDLGYSILHVFQRVQWNYTATGCNYDTNKMCRMLAGMRKQHILQIDDKKSLDIFLEIQFSSVGPAAVYPIFDKSGGIGETPTEWPEILKFGSNSFCGYAGGLGPKNIFAEMHRINVTTGYNDNQRIWIDMETNIRSNNDSKFDFDKIRECLLIAEDWVSDDSDEVNSILDW